MPRKRLLIAAFCNRARRPAGGGGICVPDPSDKHRQTLALTTKAEKALKRLTAIHLTEIRELAPRLIEILHSLQDRGELQDDPWSDP